MNLKTLFVLLSLVASAVAQTTTLTINQASGQINAPTTGGAVPNFTSLKVGTVTITPTSYITTTSRVAFSATWNADTLLTGSNVKQVFGAATQTGSAFVAGTGGTQSRFTAPRAGWYHFGATINLFSGSGDGRVNTVLYKNGSAFRNMGLGDAKGSTTDMNLTGSILVYLAAADYIELFMADNDGTPFTVWSNAQASSFWGFELGTQ